MQDPLKELRLCCDSGRIAVQFGESVMEALTGQLLLKFGEAEVRPVLSFPKQTAHDALKAAEAARRFESSVWFEKALELVVHLSLPDDAEKPTDQDQEPDTHAAD